MGAHSAISDCVQRIAECFEVCFPAGAVKYELHDNNGESALPGASHLSQVTYTLDDHGDR